MTEEKKSKTKEKEKITTVQDGIFRCEGDLMDVDDPNAYVVSLGDQIRRELGTLEDGHAKKFEEQLEDIMADEENEESRLNTYNTLMGAGLSGNYPLEQIEKVAEIPTLRRIAGKLIALESRISRTKEMREIKPVMRERGKQKFEAKYGKVNDAGKIIKE